MEEIRTHKHTDVSRWALPEGAIARLGHGKIEDIAFCPDSDTVAVASRIGVWLYDVSTAVPLTLWDTERGVTSTVAFSPDGNLLATGNWDGGIKVWNMQSKQCIAKMKREGRFDAVSQLAFSPDGQRIASSGGRHGAVYIWSSQTSDEVAKFKLENAPEGGPRPNIIPLAFSPDGNWMAGATPENTVSIWHIDSAECHACFRGHTAPVVALAFSPCGRLVASGDKKGALHEWNFTTAQQIWASTEYGTHSVIPAYSPEGSLMAAGLSEAAIVLWNVEHNSKVAAFAHRGSIKRIRFSDTCLQLAIVDSQKAHIWTVGNAGKSSNAAQQQVTEILGHTDVCGAVKFSPDGQTLATGYWSGGITLWDVSQLEPRATFGTASLNLIRSLDFSPCRNKLVSGSYNTTVTLWDVENRGAPITLIREDQKSAWDVEFSPESDLLVCANSAGHLYVWDEEAERTALSVKTEEIKSIAFSPDGKRIAITRFNKVAEIWNIETGQRAAELSVILPQDTARYKGDLRQIQKMLTWMENGTERSVVPKTIAFSPCGTVIAGGVFREIRLWDATTYEPCMIICLPQGCQRPEALAFSPCGRYLASGSSWQGTDKMSIRLWHVTTGENIVTFWSHPTDVQSLAFSPDGTLLASGSYDGTIILWDVKPYLQQNETS